MRLERALRNSSVHVWRKMKDAKILKGIFKWWASALHMQTGSHVEGGGGLGRRVWKAERAERGEEKEEERMRTRHGKLLQMTYAHVGSQGTLLKCFHLIFQLPLRLQLSASPWGLKSPYPTDRIFAIRRWIYVIWVVDFRRFILQLQSS